MTSQRIDLCGVRLDVRTEHAEFADYLAAQFPPASAAAAAGEADVAVQVRWSEGPRPVLRPSTVFPDWPVDAMIDRHIHVGPGSVMWLRVDDAAQIAIASEHGPKTRRFELRFHFTLGGRGWREPLKRALNWRRLPGLRRNRLSTLAYYSVYYPTWWHLEAEGKGHPLHAAGVALDGRAVVLAGLPGAGKSTLAMALLATPGAELLADNVVLHDGRLVQGCFEPLLLDEKTRRWVPEAQLLRALGRRHVFARDAFHAPHRAGGVPPGAVVVVTRGRETRLAPLSAAVCAHRILAVNEVAKEVRRYHVLASVLGMVEPEGLAHVEERGARLERLLGGVPCFALQVREGAPEEAVAALRDVAAPARQAVR
jgi:hypothetical protein